MPKTNSDSNPINAIPVVIGAVFVLLIVGIYNSIAIIKPGEVGVVIRLGEAQENALHEGIHLVIPFITDVKKIDVRILKAEVKTEAASKDLQVVKAVIVVNHRVDQLQAVKLYRDIGLRYLETVIEPSIQEAFKADAAKYTAEALITERSNVSEGIYKSISSRLEQFGVIVSAINITSFDFSPEFNRAIEDKVMAEQKALQAKNELERFIIEAQQKVETAKGEAEAIVEKAKAEAEGLELKKPFASMDLIWLTAVEKWDGKLPTHLFGTPPVPVLETGK